MKAMSQEEQQLSENGYEADSELDQKQNSSTDSDHADKSCSMAISTDSEDEMKERRNKVRKKQKGKLCTGSREERTFAKSTGKTDKENFTPPGSHSTPSLGQKVARSLDDSLFGFNRLDSPLPFSPVSSISSRGKPSPSRTVKPRFVSSHKGKRKGEQLFDFPRENEKKVKKRKSKREVIRYLLLVSDCVKLQLITYLFSPNQGFYATEYVK